MKTLTLVPDFLKDKILKKQPQIEVSVFLEHDSTVEESLIISFPLTEDGKSELEKLVLILEEASYLFGRWNDKSLEFFVEKLSKKLVMDYNFIYNLVDKFCRCDCKFGEAMVAQLTAYQVKYYFENELVEFEKLYF